MKSMWRIDTKQDGPGKFGTKSSILRSGMRGEFAAVVRDPEIEGSEFKRKRSRVPNKRGVGAKSDMKDVFEEV